MRRLENGFLEEVGLGDLSNELGHEVLQAFRDRHTQAVGEQIWAAIGPDQRADIERYLEADDHWSVGMLVRTAVPNLGDIVYATFLLLLIELQACAPVVIRDGRVAAEFRTP